MARAVLTPVRSFPENHRDAETLRSMLKKTEKNRMEWREGMAGEMKYGMEVKHGSHEAWTIIEGPDTNRDQPFSQIPI